MRVSEVSGKIPPVDRERVREMLLALGPVPVMVEANPAECGVGLCEPIVDGKP